MMRNIPKATYLSVMIFAHKCLNFMSMNSFKPLFSTESSQILNCIVKVLVGSSPGTVNLHEGSLPALLPTWCWRRLGRVRTSHRSRLGWLQARLQR